MKPWIKTIVLAVIFSAASFGTKALLAQFTIPDNTSVFNTNQSRIFATDIAALQQGIRGEGVVAGCTVTAQGTPDMTLAVAAGTVTFAGASSAVTSGNVTITTADATNPRIDIVVVNSSGTKSVTAGTPAASPAMPSIPASSVVLAAVYVPAGATSISSNKIIDKRVIVTAPTGNPMIAGGRLTLQSGTAVSTSDQTSKTTVYYTPYKSTQVSLYDGTRWEVCSFAETSLALGTLTSGNNYDVWGADSGSCTLTLSFSAAWTNDSTRSDAVATQDGITVKSSDHTKRLLGTVRTTSTTTTEDSAAKRNVYNTDNQVLRSVNATVVTSENNTTTASYTDLATAGPTIGFFAPGGLQMVTWTVMCQNGAGGNNCYVVPDISGATTIAAADTGRIQITTVTAGVGYLMERTYGWTLTAGYNTLKLKYKVSGGTIANIDRVITVRSLM